MASTSTAFKELTDANSVGTRYGQTSTEPLGFYGVTTCVPQFVFSTGVLSQSISSGALASTLVVALNRLGLINCTTILP